MAVKLEKRGRWLPVKIYLRDNYGIQVHFSDHHTTYCSAYTYTIKEDTDTFHSQGHPDLSTFPRTETAISLRNHKGKDKGPAKRKRKGKEKRLSIYDVCKVTYHVA